MPVLNVGFVGTDKLARKLAKRSDSRDIDSYVYKENIEGGSRILSILRPLKHPESIRPLLSVLNVSKKDFASKIISLPLSRSGGRFTGKPRRR